MDFHGDINLQHNKMEKMVFQTENVFPLSPKVGRIVFKNQKLYMCVAIDGNSSPIWIPLTNKIDTYVHNQVATITAWTVNHALNTTIPIVQVYNTSGELIIPDEVEIINSNQLVIRVGSQIGGKAVVMFSHTIPEIGIGIL